MKKILFLILICFCSINLSKEEGVEQPGEIEPEELGNFALPTSQEPGPLFSFGQFILDQGDFLTYLYTDYIKNSKKSLLDFSPSVLYGIKDDLSIFISAPVAMDLNKKRDNDDNDDSDGSAGFLVQMEYVFYSKNTKKMANQMTFVSNITSFPEESNARRTPRRIFGTTSFLLGLTASHTNFDWYCFTSIGTILTGSHNHNQIGNTFLYQFGISKNIMYKTNKYIFNWMIEFDGIYRQRNRLSGKLNPDSGGNQIFLGPSLFFSTKNLILHGGVSWPIYQHLFGKQNKEKYFTAIYAALKF